MHNNLRGLMVCLFFVLTLIGCHPVMPTGVPPLSGPEETNAPTLTVV